MIFRGWNVVFLVLMELSGLLHAETISGRIVGVTDGDTLVLVATNRDQYKIRLSGIDAPEKRQPFGERSKTNLSALAFGQEATADCPKKDRYGRHVCTVFVRGTDVGLTQIADGMAWWYQKYSNQQTSLARADYEAAEFSARTKQQGLWTDKNPVPPWDWRQSLRLN